MEVIELPFLFRHITCRDSVETMKEVKLAGVVIRNEFLGYFLLRAVEIYAALADHPFKEDLRLGDVQNGFRIHEISDSDVGKWNLNLDSPHQTHSDFEQLLDHENVNYGLLASSSNPGLVRIVTRHEGFKEQMSSAPKACYCDNRDFMHPYPPPAKSSGDLCYCGHRISCR
jgi:hypothetical protein